MDVPSAIREDHDPSLRPCEYPFQPIPFRTFLPLAFFRWTDFRCPHCHAVFRRDYLPHKVRLGSGERICRKCGKAFDDGSREWPELGPGDKFRYIFPVPILGIVGGTLVCGVITLFIVPRDVLSLVAGAMVIGITLVPLIPWCAIRLPLVYRSIHRYGTEAGPMRRRLRGNAG